MMFSEVYAIVTEAIENYGGQKIVSMDQSLSAPPHAGGLDLDELDQAALMVLLEETLGLEITQQQFETPRELARHIMSLKTK